MKRRMKRWLGAGGTSGTDISTGTRVRRVTYVGLEKGHGRGRMSGPGADLSEVGVV